MTQMTCPICGGQEFVDFRGVPNTRCLTCQSNERARAAMLLLQHHLPLRPGLRILHLAPETGLGRRIAREVQEGYDPCDFDPDRYAHRLGMPVRRLDLCRDAAGLPEGHYDAVIHNHVMEHIPCNVTLALQHLHRAIRPGGLHLFSVPVFPGSSEEDMNPALTDQERLLRFRQRDHMRRFGRDDFDLMLGPVLGLTSAYTLTDHLAAEALTRANIRKSRWSGPAASVYFIRKEGPTAPASAPPSG